VSELAQAGEAVRDSAVPSTQRVLEPGTYWGGSVTANTGEQVTIYVSDRYAQDPAIEQRWADFLAGLVHGPELEQVVVYLAPETEVQRVCGDEALACYGGPRNLLVAPGEDPATDLSAEAVITHEYGHHVAAHRTNAPWPAIDYGTKRWASYEEVCARSRAGELAPGSEIAGGYQRNPGEAFAETYRVMNERKAGLPEPPWEVVTRRLYPDATALSLLEQDVVSPWQRPTTLKVTGVRTRTFAVATPLDGTMRVSIRSTGTPRVAILAKGRPAVRGSRTAATTICGERSVRVRVTSKRPFTATLTRP
jgi:hypothetical protein